MNNGRKIQLSEDFLKALEGKSSLFLYNGKAKIPESLKDLVLHRLDLFDGTMVHMYYNEPSEIMRGIVDQQIIPLGISRNLTTTMIKLRRLIMDRDYFILLDSLEELTLEVGMKPCSRFLSVLLKRSRVQEGTIISFFKVDPLSSSSEHHITRSFDNIFNIDENGILKQDNNKLSCTDTSSSDNKASTDSNVSNEMEKIKDIFRLTPEEQEELDKIVGDSIREFSIS
ncbi:MAG: hypothetical protein SCH66_06550 [Methanolobus sp.]|nr:hypothetical protein [Methanolobus sp.]